MTSLKKLQDSFWKFDRAAGHVDKCREQIRDWVEREAAGEAEPVRADDPDFVAHLAALEDLPLFLDSMLFYLRIQVDAFAALVPFFYERGDIISSRSFRDQRKWFTRKRRDFDGGYASILNHDLPWWKALAGKNPTGLRDIVVHRGGTYQLGWTRPVSDTQFELRASLLDDAGFAEDDMPRALRDMTVGWCSFLDDSWRYFAAKLSDLLGDGSLTDEKLTRYVHCGGKELPSFWVYPRAA